MIIDSGDSLTWTPGQVLPVLVLNEAHPRHGHVAAAEFDAGRLTGLTGFSPARSIPPDT
jgi:hypothetical protein